MTGWGEDWWPGVDELAVVWGGTGGLWVKQVASVVRAAGRARLRSWSWHSSVGSERARGLPADRRRSKHWRAREPNLWPSNRRSVNRRVGGLQVERRCGLVPAGAGGGAWNGGCR